MSNTPISNNVVEEKNDSANQKKSWIKNIEK